MSRDCSPSARLQHALLVKQASHSIFEGRIKDFEAACMLGNPNNIESARAELHAALDAALDAEFDLVKTTKEQLGFK